MTLADSLKKRVEEGGRVVSFHWPVPGLEPFLVLRGEGEGEEEVGGGEGEREGGEEGGSRHNWFLYSMGGGEE